MKKVVVITGASAGIGKVTAKLMAEEGHRVYALARRMEKMRDLEQLGIQTMKMDITKEADRVEAIETIISSEGRIDVLLNNAGFGLIGPVEDIPIDDARYQFEVNIFGLAALTKLVLPHMRKEKSGRIINMSSIAGKVNTPLGAWYNATKHALEGWSDCLRLEVKEFGIDIVLIEPGLIQTEFANVFEEKLKNNSEESAYKRLLDKMVEVNKNGVEGSNPKVIAELVKKAIESNRPKTRYVAGKLAKPMLFFKKVLPDRTFDKIIMSMIRG